MRVYSLMSFLLIIPIMALRIGGGSTELESVGGARQKTNRTGRMIAARLSHPAPPVVRRAPSVLRRSFIVPMISRPASLRPEWAAGGR
jgi:hypothetical protein